MAYILNKTNGTVLAKLEDGAINQSTDLIFVGKNYAGYGEIINEDLLKLLENFSNKTAPTKPITGQLWYNSASKQINVYNGTTFNKLPAVEYSTTPPVTLSNIGDLWFNTTEKKLYVRSSGSAGIAGYTLVGPTSSGNAAAVILATAIDSDRNTRYVLKHTINGAVVAVSSAEEFTLASDDALYGSFTAIKRGFTVSGANSSTGDSSASGYYFWGTAATANRLGQYLPEEFLLKTAYDAGIVNGFNIDNDNGVLVGTGGIFKFHADAGAREGKITAVQGTKISFNLRYPTANDSIKRVLVIDGNKLVPSDVTFSIGTSGTRFSELYTSNGDITNFSAYNATVTGSLTAPTKPVSDYSNAVATTAFVKNSLPAGVIVMWSGNAENVPAGWVLCNGQNGTPDLRNRFVIGAPAAVGPGMTPHGIGGDFTSWTSNNGGHSHGGRTGEHALTITQMPSHYHSVGVRIESTAAVPPLYTSGSVVQPGDGLDHVYGQFTAIPNTGIAGSGGPHSHVISADGTHGHSVYSVPPYYALCYIMKL